MLADMFLEQALAAALAALSSFSQCCSATNFWSLGQFEELRWHGALSSYEELGEKDGDPSRKGGQIPLHATPRFFVISSTGVRL